MAFQCPIPGSAPKDVIFYFEALAVCSAVHLATNYPGARRLIVKTDNMNTFNIFRSMAASPDYNLVLRSAVDVMLSHNLDLRVFHIPGKLNVIADLVSRYKNDRARLICPGLDIRPFTPPQDALGASKL